MNDRYISKLRKRSVAIAAIGFWAFGVVAAQAVQAPIGCNGNGVGLNIARQPASVVVGGTVNYNFSIFNLDDPSISLIACNVEDVDVIFYCPGANGQPDFTTPQVITTNLNLPAGTPP